MPKFTLPKFGQKKRKALAGLDIGSSSLKLVELSLKDSQYTLESYAVLPLPEEAIVDREIKNIELFSETVKQIIAQSKTNAQAFVLAMPSSFVISKVIMLDTAVIKDDLKSSPSVIQFPIVIYNLKRIG